MNFLMMRSKYPTALLYCVLYLQLIVCKGLNEEHNIPTGYYAFEKASSQLNKPPKVRKPPYIPTDIECPGLNFGSTRFSPKYTLCGDLNEGSVPKNPMGQNVLGQPYPFELIKNKTLHFLANALPVLKREMHSIPKVARFFSASDLFEQPTSYQRRFIREVENNSTITNSSITYPKENSTKLLRQNLCDGNSLCQAIESLKEDGPFSKSFLSNVVSAVSSAATIGNIANLINQYGSPSIDSPQNNNSNKSTISQVLSTLSTMGNSNGYNPLISIIDYISSFQNSPLADKYPSRRRKPLEPEDLLPVSPESPQTPCPAIDEYISPTYARNYQGVWKYVVQIPSEGYFTQTIQRTSCLKNRCQFLEGACSESPRWVSLLVAEIFYPDVYFPVSPVMPISYNPNNNILPIINNHKYKPKITPILEFPAFAHELQRMDGIDQNQNDDKMTPRRGRKASKPNMNLEMDSDKEEIVSKNVQKPNNDCDGIDKVGCYIIRVYYDWFLVNGSCKCWKSPKASHSNSINDAIKRIFIGKWR